jgi:Protein of unknown function (DUF1761)
MNVLGVNLVYVVLAAVASMAMGFLWYSPLLFAKPWMLAMGYDPNDKAGLAEMRKGAGKLYGAAFLASLAAAFVLGKVVVVTTVISVPYGMKVGFAMWLGFVASVQLTDTLFGRKPYKLFLINTGYQLACYLVMGAILAVSGRY